MPHIFNQKHFFKHSKQLINNPFTRIQIQILTCCHGQHICFALFESSKCTYWVAAQVFSYARFITYIWVPAGLLCYKHMQRRSICKYFINFELLQLTLVVIRRLLNWIDVSIKVQVPQAAYKKYFERAE